VNPYKERFRNRTLLEHLNSPTVFIRVLVTPSLVFCAVIVLLSLFGRCILCHFSIYGFQLSLNVLLDEVVGEPLQGKVPELHHSGAPELTHGVYSGSCYAIFSFLCSDCSVVPFFGRCILCHSSIYGFQLSLGVFKLFFPTLSNNILFPHGIPLPE
jgi:hypothetical protein